MLDVKQATKVFSAGTASEHHALNGLDLHLDDGEFVSVVGSRQARFRRSAARCWLDRRRIFLDGRISFLSGTARSAGSGASLPRDPVGNGATSDVEKSGAGCPEGSGSHFEVRSANRGKDLFRTELEKYHMDLENRMKTKVGLLSGGQRQVVTLLMCTLVMPKLLLLDEHTAALDPATADKVIQDPRGRSSRGNHLTTADDPCNLRSTHDWKSDDHAR